MSNVRRRKRTERDRDFFVCLKDKEGTGNRRISVGNFWAMSPDEAIDVAQKTYPGLFTGMETRSLIAHAEETFALHSEEIQK